MPDNSHNDVNRDNGDSFLLASSKSEEKDDFKLEVWLNPWGFKPSCENGVEKFLRLSILMNKNELRSGGCSQ